MNNDELYAENDISPETDDSEGVPHRQQDK